MKNAETVTLDLGGRSVKSVTMTYVAKDPTYEITAFDIDAFTPETVTLDPQAPIRIPAAAVAAIEVTLLD